MSDRLVPFAWFDVAAYLTRIALETGNAAHLAAAVLLRSGGAPVHFYARSWAVELGVSKRTIGRQLARAPELGYIPGSDDTGSIVCAPVDAAGFSDPSLFAAVRKWAGDNPGDDALISVDNPGNTERPFSGGSGLPDATPHAGVATLFIADKGSALAEPLSPEERNGTRAGVEASIPIFEEPVSFEAKALGCLHAQSFESNYAATADAAGLGLLLASIAAFVRPYLDNDCDALGLASAVLDRGREHAEGRGKGNRPSGYSWGLWLLRDPLLYGRRRTFLQAMGSGWGDTGNPWSDLSPQQGAALRRALSG